MGKLEKVFEYIDKNADTHDGYFHGVINEELISLAENKLELKFPPSYKKFLARYGCGCIDGYEFYGIIDDKFDECVPDVVGVTIMDRRKYGVPKEFIIIVKEDEYIFVIDTSQKSDDGENPVVELSLGDLTKGAVAAPSFEDFIFDYLSLDASSAEQENQHSNPPQKAEKIGCKIKSFVRKFFKPS